MSVRRYAKYTVIAAGAICLLAVAFSLRFPRDPLYLCQKILDGGLEQWKLEAGTNVWPNVEGNSGKSFAQIEKPYLSPSDDHAYSLAYGYVPGLKDDDPPDLIFMYLKRMTRRTWNGDHSASAFARKKWMVFSPNFWGNGDIAAICPEGGELVDTAEFRRRFQKTLEFLRDNNRPHWKAVVAEQTQFLNSLEQHNQ
jgi:hypothetical protein